MKFKMFIPVVLVLCLAFSLCACGTTANTNETTTTPATAAATENKTDLETTAPAETNAEAEAAFTEDDAIELVKTTYEFSDEYYYKSRGIVEVDGVNYYGIDLMKSLDTNSTYLSTFFVTTDGSEVLKGYYENDIPEIIKNEPTLTITEDNAVKAVEAAYDFEEGCYLTLRGTEEIDGTNYYAVDLRKSLDTNSTYLSTYFITANGTIIQGYYEGDTPVLAE